MKTSAAVSFVLASFNLLFLICSSTPASVGGKTTVLQLVQSIPLPHLTGGTNHLAADARHGRFFVTSPGEKKVVVVDLNIGKELKVLTNVPAAAAAFLPDLNQLCLSGNSGVSFFDAGSLALIGTLDLGTSVDELHYEAKQQRLYVGLMDSKQPGIGVIDAAKRKLLAKLKLPSKPQGFVVENNGPHVYANTPGTNEVTVLDRDRFSTVGAWKLSDAQLNYPIALDEDKHRLFVGCRRPARLLVLDTTSGKVVSEADTGGDADDMSFDPTVGQIYLACGDGVITVVQQINADRYQRLANVPTADGARNSLFVPDLKAFYVAMPHRAGQSAELRAYRVKD
jgi:DNA-binding beta-propeller fold protein YncE